MEVRVNPKTTEALQRDGTLRCLLQVRYTRDDRHSVSAIAWARKKAEDVSRNLLKGAGLDGETATFMIDLNGYKLGMRNHRSYICYDLYLEKCSSAVRERIEGCIRQPIHLITKRGNVFIARRAPTCDNKVALFFERARERSQPPRQLLPEVESPPTYRSGQRLDQPRVEAAHNNAEGDAKNKLENLIQYAAEKVARYVGGNFGEHIINQLELQLYITKVMVAGPKENVKNSAVKNINPVSEKHARNIVTSITTFLSGSLRAQKTNEVKSALDHAAERLEEKIEAKKSAKDGAKRSLTSDAEKNAKDAASDDKNGGQSRMDR